jgi:hypothetical protein
MVFNLKQQKEIEKRRSEIYDEWKRLLDFALAHPEWSMDEAYYQHRREIINAGDIKNKSR